MVAWMKDIALEESVDMEGVDPEGQQILQRLFQVQERVETSNGPYKVTVGTMVSLIIKNPPLDPPKGQIPYDAAKRYLQDIGFRIEGGYLHIANSSIWIRRHVGIAYESSWPRLLRTMPGAKSGKPMWFGYTSRTTKIPVGCVPVEPIDTTPGFTPPDD